MKKVLYILTTLFIVSSCTVDTHVEDLNYNGGTLTYFTEKSSSKDVTVSLVSDPVIKVEVGSTETSSSDRTYSISIDVTTTSITDIDYSLITNIVTIPAGSNIGYFEITTIYDSMQDASDLVLNLEEINNSVATFRNTFTLKLAKKCNDTFVSVIRDTTLYTVVTTYGFHDFLSAYPSNTISNFTFTSLGGNEFQMADFSGGLYSTGPYSTAYSYSLASFVFKDECNKLVWEDQNDPWGTIVPAENSENSIDPDTGVITISWYCNGYGENGVSVYTPQ